MIDKKNTRILVVDDEEFWREKALRSLQTAGYQDFQELEDGRTVSTTAERYEPDLILMDTDMSLMDGPTACEEVRRRPTRRTMAIIGMSNGPYEKRWLDARADGFVRKDLLDNPAELDVKIQSPIEKCQKINVLYRLHDVLIHHLGILETNAAIPRIKRFSPGLMSDLGLDSSAHDLAVLAMYDWVRPRDEAAYQDAVHSHSRWFSEGLTRDEIETLCNYTRCAAGSLIEGRKNVI